jgi:hypothetical protein
MMVTKAVRRIPGFLLVFAMLALLVGGLSGASLADSVSLDAVLAKLAPSPSSDALRQIPELGRKLLALRSYVRYGAKIADRWSWTKEQIKAFEGSPEQRALLAEIAAVSKHFRAANPGYEIYVHGTVRSLDEQLANWNSNDSVRAAGEEILAAYKAAFGKDGLGSAKIDVKRLDAWLRDFKPSKRANLAAPGLTLHGRASAIDFQVMKDGRIYAGANSQQLKSVWRAEGWDQKLKASIEAAGPSFSGPLADPDEPWHYDYAPPPAATIASGQVAKLADIVPATPGARVCFARSYDAKHLREHPRQRVAGVTFLIRSTGFDDRGEWVLKPDGKYKYTRYLFAIRFAQRDGNRAPTTSGECAEAEKTGCHVECDGGGFALEKSGDGLLLRLLDEGIRIDDCDEKDVRLMPGTDDKAFRVEKVAEAQCRALEKATLER